LPLKLYASANRSPLLAGSHHDVDPTVMHRLPATDFWTAMDRRYGSNPNLVCGALQWRHACKGMHPAAASVLSAAQGRRRLACDVTSTLTRLLLLPPLTGTPFSAQVAAAHAASRLSAD
jgi:hypothetical protein